MPFSGTANNPSGFNGSQMFEHESSYGSIKRLEQSVQQAPIAPNSAVNAPRRAKRAAVRGQAQAAAPVAPPTPEEAAAAVADVLTQLASLPGASPLLQEYAARAQQQVNLGSR